MLAALGRNITMTTFKLLLAFTVLTLFPLTGLAEPVTFVSCESARTQVEPTRKTLHLLKQRQQHIQQRVQTIYQELYACQTAQTLSREEEHCTQLLAQGHRQFQALISAITLTHQTSQQLAHQTRQVQTSCPSSSEKSFPQLTHLQQP